MALSSAGYNSPSWLPDDVEIRCGITEWGCAAGFVRRPTISAATTTSFLPSPLDITARSGLTLAADSRAGAAGNLRAGFGADSLSMLLIDHGGLTVLPTYPAIYGRSPDWGHVGPPPLPPGASRFMSRSWSARPGRGRSGDGGGA